MPVGVRSRKGTVSARAHILSSREANGAYSGEKMRVYLSFLVKLNRKRDSSRRLLLDVYMRIAHIVEYREFEVLPRYYRVLIVRTEPLMFTRSYATYHQHRADNS